MQAGNLVSEVRRRIVVPGMAPWFVASRLRAGGGGPSVRSGLLADTQVVCGAGPFELDVLVREIETPWGLEFAGQVTQSGRIHDPVRGLPLALVDGRSAAIRVEAVTDEFGEFGLEAGDDGLFGIRLGPARDSPCVLVWEGREW